MKTSGGGNCIGDPARMLSGLADGRHRKGMEVPATNFISLAYLYLRDT